MLRYVAALALFDGYYRLGPRRWELVIADESKEFLEKLRLGLRNLGIPCAIKQYRHDNAYRLRIYRKEAVTRLFMLSQELLNNPDETLLAAAIDAEGNVKKYRGQPFRTKVVQKRGAKADAIRQALQRLGIAYREYAFCRARNLCNYVVFVVSSEEENRKLYNKVKIRHPGKLQEIHKHLGLQPP